MVNDSTIDESTAKYWCIFMDKDISKLLTKASQYSPEEGKKLAKIAKKAKDANESSQVDEMSWDWVQAMHQAAFPMATGNPFQPNFRAMDPSSGVPSLQDQQKDNVIAAAAAAALAGLSMVPGAWTALAGALGTAGTWLLGVLGSGAAALTSGAVMAIAGGLVTVSSWLYPRIAKLVKDMRRSGVLAECQFEADGEKYVAVFSMTRKRWELVFPGRRLASRTDVPKEDIAAFFQTKFFQKFLARCKDKMMAVYGDKKKVECLKTLAKMSDKKSKDDVQMLVDAQPAVEQFLVPGKYVTESLKQA